MEKLYSKSLRKTISQQKVLVVGAGGIGSELAKTLPLSGFINIQLIDMDVIDVSNLNRQFLFRREHVGQPKSQIVQKQILDHNASWNITSKQGSIMETRFNIDYFKQFDLIFNALDNIAARMHINRICINAQIPLFDSGTNGYLGNASVILAKKTRCYQCTKRQLPKQFPICSIRGFPQRMIHCTVWAKSLFQVIFGGIPNIDYIPEEVTQKLKSEQISNKQEIFIEIGDRFFNSQIQEKKLKYQGDQDKIQKLKKINFVEKLKDKQITQPASAKMKDKILYTIGEYAKQFIDSSTQLMKLIVRLLNLIKYFMQQTSIKSNLTFDKDHKLSMKFINAATNLRAYTHGIKLDNQFNIKQIAGNIIPAISTTNAIAASFQVQEAIKFLQNKPIHNVYCNFPGGSKISSLNAFSQQPNPDCIVCQNQTQQLMLYIKDLNQFVFKDFVDSVLKRKLMLTAPLVVCDELFYQEDESEDQEEEKQRFSVILEKTFSQLQIKWNDVLDIDDINQKIHFQIVVKEAIEGQSIEDEVGNFILQGNLSKEIQEKQIGQNKKVDNEKQDKIVQMDNGQILIMDQQSDQEESQIIIVNNGEEKLKMQEMQKQKQTQENDMGDKEQKIQVIAENGEKDKPEITNNSNGIVFGKKRIKPSVQDLQQKELDVILVEKQQYA